MACESYYAGECTDGACRYAYWVREGWGNAGDWLSNAGRDGFQTTNVPTLGAVVVYAPGDGYSTFGHCGVVIALGQGGQFQVHEMNYVAWNQYDDRWSSLYDVAGFILPPGVQPGAGGDGLGRGGPSDVPAGAGEVVNAWSNVAGFLNVAAPQDLSHWAEIHAYPLDIG